jgi:hypothetical protein
MQSSGDPKIAAVARTPDSARYTDPSAAASDAFAADAGPLRAPVMLA